jgi:hypothetical protein
VLPALRALAGRAPGAAPQPRPGVSAGPWAAVTPAATALDLTGVRPGGGREALAGRRAVEFGVSADAPAEGLMTTMGSAAAETVVATSTNPMAQKMLTTRFIIKMDPLPETCLRSLRLTLPSKRVLSQTPVCGVQKPRRSSPHFTIAATAGTSAEIVEPLSSPVASHALQLPFAQGKPVRLYHGEGYLIQGLPMIAPCNACSI